MPPASDERTSDQSPAASSASVPTMGAPDAKGAIYDARTLGAPKMALFGLQHMFAMFGATILVPTLTGLSVSATLLFAGLGTLLFHLITKGKVPAFLGSSFAFIAGYVAIAPAGEPELLPYACLGVACSGLLYLVLSALFRIFGTERIMRFFPPVVTGPIVICIGLILASSAIANCETNWPIAIVAIAIIIVANIWGRGMIRIIPILLGVIGSYAVAAVTGIVDFAPVADAAWIGLPVLWSNTVFALAGPGFDAGLAITAIITIMPLAFATMIEHIGDMSAISSTCNRNYLADPGLHRTLLGDGLATSAAGLFGGPPNTTYAEVTGAVMLTKNYNPKIMTWAAVIAITLAFVGKFGAILQSIPVPVMGGILCLLFGTIASVGMNTLIRHKVDLSEARNLVIVSVTLVFGIGGVLIGSGTGPDDIGLKGIALCAIVAIVLNLLLPGNDGWQNKALDEQHKDSH